MSRATRTPASNAPRRTPLSTDALVGYLTFCGGSDRFECWTPDGEPDLSAARELADALRLRHADLLDRVVAVRQNGHRVVLQLVHAR